METLSTNPRFGVIWDGCVKVIANGKTNEYDNDRWSRYADADSITKNDLTRRNGDMLATDERDGIVVDIIFNKEA